MYLKYNNVLRFFSGNDYLREQCVHYKLGVLKEGKFEWTLAPTMCAQAVQRESGNLQGNRIGSLIFRCNFVISIILLHGKLTVLS